MSSFVPRTYNIRTWGCQMNEADSQRLASEFERLGLSHEPAADSADVIVLNTCVVRQSAEDKVYGRLGQLKRLKQDNPEKIIGLMGCLVGFKNPAHFFDKFPHVDVFMAPSDNSKMLAYLHDRVDLSELTGSSSEETLILPDHERNHIVTAHIPIVLGCSHGCAYCVIPYRRGKEISRPMDIILEEARSLARQGIKEVTLLGQIVDRYGLDFSDGPLLPELLKRIHEIDGIERIRFLTSHPNYMTDDLLEAVRDLPKVMPHIEVPIQAGSNAVLENMRRGYTREFYIDLIGKIRETIPGAGINTDIIVGFPGETEDQFMETYDLLDQLKLDKAHVAMYSPRPQTVSFRKMEDDVSREEKKRRLLMLDELMKEIVGDINARFLGKRVEALVEGKHKGKWRGRIPQNKLVFIESEEDLFGQFVKAEISWTGPWSMQGKL